MKVLDLFSGTGSATTPFVDRGHQVLTVDIDAQFQPNLCMDVRDLNLAPVFDFVWASPPCTSFSVASLRHHWQLNTDCLNCGGVLERVSGQKWWCACGQPKAGQQKVYTPKSEEGLQGLELLRETFRLIEQTQPPYWIIENPRALMRSMPELQGIERRTVTHCQYGDFRMKPTDLFGVFPEGFEARACNNGDSCHESAPRGSWKVGTQKLSKVEKGMLPYQLGLEICIALEEL